jgi:hypothetical protein
MFLVLTSSADPDLSLFKSLPETAIVVPAHLAQEGWIYEVGYGERAQLVASTGVLAASEISTVLTRIRRVWPSELVHIRQEDREFVASEMTAFLAALLNELPCIVVNRPSATCLLGPPWTAEHWLRIAADRDFTVCGCDGSQCDGLAEVVILGGKPIRGGTGPAEFTALASQLAEWAGVLLISAKFCLRHMGLREASLRPDLDADLVRAISQFKATSTRKS